MPARSSAARLLRRPPRADWPALAAFFTPLAVYLLTMSRTVYNLDSAELTVAAATGGITRATGYPLYLTLGYLWSRLPVGDVGFRMNLLSALSAALTLLLCERILHRLGARPAARLGAVGLLAFSKFFWAEALVAEVYTLQTALMAAMILALLRWSDRPAPLHLGWVGLAVGLGLSHHMATVLLLPGIAFYLLTSHPKQVFQWKALLAAGLGLLLGLSFYLYLPLRYAAAPAFNYAGGYDASGVFHALDLSSLAGIWWLVTGRSFSGLMFAYPLDQVGQQVWEFITYLSGTFFAVGIGPGLLGLWALFRRSARLGSMLALMFCAHVFFYVNYRVADKEWMFLPAYLLWALWLGLGLETLFGWLDSPVRSGRLKDLLLPGLVMGSLAFALLWNWPLVDLSTDTSTRDRAEEMLALVEPNALVLGYWDSVPILQYYQLIENRRPDIQVINRFMISPENLARLVQNEVQVRPVYATFQTNDLSPTIRAIPLGPLYRLTTP